MIILALDTTSEFGSVALRREHQTAAEVHLHSTDGFGHLIINSIQDVLAQANVTLEQVDCFAAANGPGSFTGVRVALSVVKGLAEAFHKPAAAISNLRALSLAGKSSLRAVVLDARRNQLYAAVYDAETKLVVDEIVCTWDEFAEHIPPGAEVIGHEPGSVPLYLAGAVAACAEIDGPSGWHDPVGLDANYVRRSDAQQFWKDPRL